MQRSRDELQAALEEFLRRVVSHVQGDAMGRLSDLDLTFTQTRTVLLLACTDEPLPINAIAEHLGLSWAAAGRNVDDLVQAGIALRTEHPHDRRVKQVTLSARGLEIADRHLEHKRRALQFLVRRIPDDQADALTAALLPILAGDSLRADITRTSLAEESHHVH